MPNPIKKVRKNQAATTWLMVLGIIVIAANLRAPLTSVGSLVSFIRDDIQISNTLAGLITTVPLLAFALLSPLVPKLGRKFGAELHHIDCPPILNRWHCNTFFIRGSRLISWDSHTWICNCSL